MMTTNQLEVFTGATARELRRWAEKGALTCADEGFGSGSRMQWDLADALLARVLHRAHSAIVGPDNVTSYWPLQQIARSVADATGLALIAPGGIRIELRDRASLWLPSLALSDVEEIRLEMAFGPDWKARLIDEATEAERNDDGDTRNRQLV